MRSLDLFSGIGGFALGGLSAGMETVAFCEINEFCQRLLSARFPGIPICGDVNDMSMRWLEEQGVLSYGAIALVTGGFPCQDLSVAGKRAGLAGARSGLFWEIARVADEIAAPWLLLENVPGLLSSRKGRDFATVLGELTGYEPEAPKESWRNAGICHGPKRTACWRVLDAQYFGVAQRRRRVFIVASTRRTGPVEVLLESESCSGDPPPRREAGARTPAGPQGSIGGYRKVAFGEFIADGTASAVCARDYKDATDLITHSLTSRYDSSEDGTGRGLPLVMAPAFSKRPGQQIATRDDGVSFALTAGEPPRVLESSVRRLTPTECERLQGFPDGWTLLGEKTAGSHRYRACGNAVAVPVVAWIMKRIADVERRVSVHATA